MNGRRRCLERIAVLEREIGCWPPWELVAEPRYDGQTADYRFRQATLKDYARPERPPDVPDTTPDQWYSSYPPDLGDNIVAASVEFRACHCAGGATCEVCRPKPDAA